ncbi:MAG: XRE family transcriptional regulator [candidate division WOR-3 bacterium]
MENTNIASYWVNPRILKGLREKFNLTEKEVEELSKKLKKAHFQPITANQLIEWEKGEAQPDLVHLETLSEIYNCPVGYFFLDNLPEETLPLSHRGLSHDKPLSYLTHISLKKFYEVATFTVELIEKFDISVEVKITPNRIPLDYSLIEEIAEEERKKIGWDEKIREKLRNEREAFEWWRKKLENLGIFCLEFKLNPKEVRGASIWLKNYPFILVNHEDFEAFSGRIFTLIHEYVHLISENEGIICDFRGKMRGENPEPFVNKLSARILLSYQDLERQLNKLGLLKYKEIWHDNEIDKIRKPFFVSRDVIVIMLQEMGLAPHNLYEEKLKEWKDKKAFGKGGKKPTLIEQKKREFGYSFLNLLKQSIVNPSFPILDLSYIMDIKVEKIKDILR